MMERKILGMCRRRFWLPVLIIFFVWFLLLYFFFYSSTILGHDQERKLSNLSTDEEDHPDHRELIDSADYRENSHESSQKNSTHDKKLLSENDTKIQRGEDDDVFIWKYYPDYIYDILDHEEEIEGKIIAELKRAEFKPVKKPKKKEPPKKKSNNNRIQKVIRKPERINRPATKISSPESCKNRYIHIYRIPRRFNEDLIKRCRSLSQWTDMCMYASNMGLGPQLDNFEKIYLEKGWFSTNQFMLELIFHNRMKQYDCLTDNPLLASAIFVPYYPGLDVARFLWSKNQMNMKDIDSLELAKWLRHKPEWKKMWGRDHFFVAGRITWDFRRYSNESSAWGNKLLLLPEIKNMTSLVIESSPWNNNDFAIPYPTYFHPSSDAEVFQWQDKMRGQTREFLFSFAGGPRPNLRDSIRDQIIRQCHISNKCKLLECVEKTNTCYKPDNVMKMFQDSVFCLQPPGDSLTRRSTFDSILSGCIPVFFHPGSAYVQYIWHLPKNYTKYSVFIPADEVKKGKIDIEKVLGRIPRKRVEAMREEVIKLIPRVIYADPSARLQTLEDAFDITIKGVLDRIGKIRKEMKEGRKKLSMDLVEKIAWKYNLFGTVEDHEWDPFFYKQYVRS